MSNLVLRAAVLVTSDPKAFLLRVDDEFSERRLSVHTRGYLMPEALNIRNPDAKHYSAIPYFHARRLLRMARFDQHRDTFIDYGCGMGRVLLLAAQYPFREVVGVEISKDLCTIAERNLSAARLGRRRDKVRVVNADAADFPVPDDAAVVFLYNPFGGETLRAVLARLKESVARRPRRVQILTCNMQNLIEQTGADWLVRTHCSGGRDRGLAVFMNQA